SITYSCCPTSTSFASTLITSCFSTVPPLVPLVLPSFPTRRSSDLLPEEHRHARAGRHLGPQAGLRLPEVRLQRELLDRRHLRREDRKSTRLNSSHVSISYAVFCLKKKNTTNDTCYSIERF